MPDNFKLLHICKDEKFIDGAHHSFELAFPGRNTFAVLKSQANAPLKYIKNIKDTREIVDNAPGLRQLGTAIEKADLVVLHGLNYKLSKLIARSDRPEKFLWMVLGAEIYQNPCIYPKGLFGNKTRKLEKRLEAREDPIIRLKKFYLSIFQSKFLFIKNVVSKIQFCGSLFKEEVELLKRNKALSPAARHLHFSFYPVEYFTAGDSDKIINGKNILLGNSASLTNNHLEAFDLLGKFDLGDRLIITPLSYGDHRYAKEVVKAGRSALGDKFVPLIHFMSLEEYNAILGSCSIIVMNHYRQQGVGNILASLWFGCKVYLSEQNIVYHYLKRIGCHLCSIESELTPDNEEALQSLTVEQIKTNRKILQAEVSEAVLVEHLRNGIVEYLERI